MIRKDKLKAVATPVMLLAMLLAAPLVRAAEDAEVDRVAACANERDDARRLECYDRATNKTKAPAAETSPTPAAAVNPSVPEQSPQPASEAPADEFGVMGSAVARERDIEQDQGQDKVQARSISAQVTEVASRPRGELVVTLDNGQVWVQKDPGPRFPIQVGDRVTITAGMLGSYRLANGKRLTQVTRVK